MGLLTRVEKFLGQIANGVDQMVAVERESLTVQQDALLIQQDNNRVLKEILTALKPGPAVRIEFVEWRPGKYMKEFQK